MSSVSETEANSSSCDVDYESDAYGVVSSASIRSAMQFWSESELSEVELSIESMPQDLVLPIELHWRVLYSSDRYQNLWGTYRLVCKAWKEEVERLAKKEWIREVTFSYPVGVTVHPPNGTVVLDGDFTFQHLDGDLAVFAFIDCDDEYRKPIIEAYKGIGSPDVYFDEIVHDVPIPGMSVDWDALTLTCNWSTVIASVLAEELHVEAYGRRSVKKLETLLRRARARCGGEVDDATLHKMIAIFALWYEEAYDEVRKKRLGRTDRNGDERLKKARSMALRWMNNKHSGRVNFIKHGYKSFLIYSPPI
ncbi:hypothetical protein MVEN_00130000 [Mycena venus]|uniref:Uncharacterized protein n=1 Tax=Mycena venus TaxID=2733690 RepID=A0A8H6Z8D9_9AGAR|nr:hypothetical protein MVEN_00130000 [Mycena venus]